MVPDPYRYALTLVGALALLVVLGVVLIPDGAPRVLAYLLLVGGGACAVPAVALAFGSFDRVAAGGSRSMTAVLAVAMFANVVIMTYNVLVLEIGEGWLTELVLVAIGGSLSVGFVAAARVAGWAPQSSGS